MPAEIPGGNELSQRVLLKTGDRGRIAAKIPAVPLQQGGGQHHIGDADGRRDALGKGAQVNHPPAAVRALERGDRPALEPEFAVKIVLN